MLNPITIRYPFSPTRRSLATQQVADLFGITDNALSHTVAEDVVLDVKPSDLVLFTGPSGSGKSSLMRAVAEQLNAVDVMALSLPEVPIVDALPGEVAERLSQLAACGLSEARLLMRLPSQLSDGERYRFRLAVGLTHQRSLMLDEFGAVLDRTLAKVLAFNLRKLVTRTGIGALCATTHDDLTNDLNPDLHVRCLGDGHVEIQRHDVKKKDISFAEDLSITDGTRADWPYFARWHYRSHELAFCKKIVMLWHGDQPIGIVIFGSPAASLTLRSHFFGLKDARSRLAMQSLNDQLWLLQRVVLHPTYRGAGIAAQFVKRACELCPVPWIETLSAMGQANPFFERAGFTRIGIIRKGKQSIRGGAYATQNKLSAEYLVKSRYSEPVYYVRDNR